MIFLSLIDFLKIKLNLNDFLKFYLGRRFDRQGYHHRV